MSRGSSTADRRSCPSKNIRCHRGRSARDRQAGDSGQTARALQLRQHLGKDRVQQRRRRRVEHWRECDCRWGFSPDRTGWRNSTPVALLQAPLMRQEGWALHEEHRERGHADVGDPIGRVAPAAWVGKGLATPGQGAEQGVQAVHPPYNWYSASVSIPESGAAGRLADRWQSGLTPGTGGGRYRAPMRLSRIENRKQRPDA